MAECPGGRNTRGTRSQFRLGMTGLGQYTGFYPIHLGDIMDAGQSSQTGLSSRNLSSPGRGTRTLTVREYEQTISELKKDNFDVKLRLFLLEKALKKNYKDNIDLEQDPIEVIVKLSAESDSLKKELEYKDKLLQDALELSEKYKVDFKELEQKCIDLQSELSSLSELPSKKELSMLINEKDSYLKHVEFLEKELTEKEEEVNNANQKIEMLAEQNRILEEKIKKRSLAIQGFIHKNFKEKEMLPEELRKVVISATQAAKNKNKEDLIVATKSISSVLHKIMSSVDLDKSEEKENIKSPQNQCLKEEFLEKSSVFLPSQNESCTELSPIQSFKEVLSERNTPEAKEFDHLDHFIRESFVQGKGLVESAVNIAEKDILDNISFSTLSPTTEENLISFSTRCSSQSCNVGENNAVNVKTVSRSPSLIHEKGMVSKSGETMSYDVCFKVSCQLKKALKENEKLKLEIAVIKELRAICEKLDMIGVQVEKEGNVTLESLKEADSERITPEAKKIDHLDSFILESPLHGKGLIESSVNIAERDILSNVNSTISQTTEGSLVSFSTKCSSHSCTVGEDNAVNIKTVSRSPDFIHKKETISKSVETLPFDTCLEESGQMKKVLKENEKLNLELTEKLVIIKDLQTKCKKLEVQVNKAGNDALKASKQHSMYTQTNVTGIDLLKEMSKLQNDAKLSNNIDQLREDILLLLLAMEDKNKELSEVKQSLSSVQEDLKNALNTTNMKDKSYCYSNEINELHERLAFSCSVNEELMRHLKNLEAFMEDLLQNKHDSSMDSMSEKSSFFAHVSKCLSESLKMSTVLSDHLSICEGSKLFEECESFVYKNGSYFDDKSLPHLNLSQLNELERHSLSYPGSIFHEEHVPFARKSNQRVNQESNLSQSCWQGWQQPNAPLNKLDMTHHVQNTIEPKNFNYLSSESDIWSEPDRDVSMQRIGISLQNSPVASKSPRKLRGKEKRLSNRLSSEQDTSSTDSQRLSKKRHGSISRRLFSKESIKNQDFTSEKFYFLLAEKYSKLKSLLDEFESIVGGKVSDEVWIRLNTVVASLGETLQKLHIARDNAKDFPSAVCGKCIVLELLAELKTSYKDADFYIENSLIEQDILQQFSREINLLKEACKEPFSFLSESTTKGSQSEQIDALTEQAKINELESVVTNLTKENKELSESLDNVKTIFSQEKAQFESMKSENFDILNQFNILKADLSTSKQKETNLALKNEEIMEELSRVNASNAELNSVLKDLEEKRKESGLALDRLTAELQKGKSDLIKMSQKCLECEKKLDHQIRKTEKCENELKVLESTSRMEREKFVIEIQELNVVKDEYVKQIEIIQEEKLVLEKENATLKNDLDTLSVELSELQDTVKKLQKTKEVLSSNCAVLELEIKNTKEMMASLHERHGLYEEEIKMLKEKEAENYRQLQQLQSDSSNEKKSLMSEISVLTKERNDVMQMLEQKKECYEKLVEEMAETNQKYIENCEQVSFLQSLNEELKNKQSSLLQKNKFFENALQSSNTECDALSRDLKLMRGTLQNLESKCLMYEKQLVASAGMKNSLVECIFNINNEILIYRKKLNEMCKTYGNENYVLWDEISVFTPSIDEDNVEKLCDNLSTESKKLLQSVDMLLGLMKKYHTKTSPSRHDSKVSGIQNENQALKVENQNLKSQSDKLQKVNDELHKYIGEKEKSAQFSAHEVQSLKEKICGIENENKEVLSINYENQALKVENKNLKSQSDKLQKVIDELQKSINEKEKSVQLSAHEIQSLKEKIYSVENEIKEGHQLLKEKDDEIIMLQEKLFNLQTYFNSITPDEIKSPVKAPSFVKKSVDSKRDSVSSSNQLPSQLVSKSSKMCQTSELPYQKADDSFASTSSLETSRNSCCEKYAKKNHSLLTKLALAKKHIEILEKEKNDLRESVLQQLQSNKDLGKRESANSKLAELESKLEQKKTFIKELKDDLLRTCNSLIEKEKQMDDLKQKLSEYEEKLKPFTKEIPDSHSIPLKTVDENIKTLKSYKWRLIETIFEIQRKFYEKKGIHLDYFNRFRDHVNNLYSMQLTHSLSKSDSMPILGSHTSKLRHNQEDEKMKNLVGLELDIECLGNLKIFLNRFCVPSVLDKTSQAADKNEIQDEGKFFEVEKQKFEKEMESLKASKFEVTDVLNISFPNIFDVPLLPDHKGALQEKSFSFEKFASNISHHLDYIEKFFIAVKQCHWFESYDITTKESLNKTEVKSLLSNIFHEIIARNSFEKLFKLNSTLKNYDIITALPDPISSSRPDVSDRESVMSEETIAVSRSESPLSFEDVSALKLPPSPNMLKLEANTLKPEGNRVPAAESYGTTKITAVGSSCDSVCQRSHYSSPDLGIESDPNHDSSAPEQKDDSVSKYQRLVHEEQKFINKSLQKSAFTTTESTGIWIGHKLGETLYAIGNLPDYELLKKEVRESLVAIKSVLSRTGDGLHHIAKYTSPRKTLEYNTMKSIKDTCIHIEVCLKAAHEVVNKFWTAYCPSENEWKHLRDKNQILTDQLANVKFLITKQENEFKKAMGKLEHAQVVKANMEKKISKKLVKTKKVIRQAELKLLQNRCQNFPPVPKYPSDQSEQLLPSNPTHQM